LILSKTAQAYWVDIIDLAKILIYSGMIWYKSQYIKH
jgi:hypothetical protein